MNKYTLLIHLVSAATCNAPTLTEGLVVTGRGCDLAGLAADETCAFSCMSNYVINGATSVTCSADGTFTPSVPTCDGKTYKIISEVLPNAVTK